MKSSRTLILSLFLMIGSVGLFAQTIEKTLVKSFNLQGAQVVALEMEGQVDVQTWSQSTMRVQMTIGLERGSSTMLRSLIQAGRYNLKSTVNEDQLLVNIPGLQREVLINGSPLQELISYQVFVPEKVQVDVISPASAGL